MARRRTTTNIFIFIPSAIYLTFLFLLVSLPMMLSFIPSFLLFSSRRVLVGHHHRFHRFLASSASSSSSSVRGRRTSRSAASLDTVTGSAADPILDPLAVSSLLTSLSTPNTTTTPTTNNTTATTTTRRRKTKEVIADTTTTTATPLIITPSEEELSMDFGKSFQLPELEIETQLEQENRHELDQDVTFDVNDHIYYYRQLPIRFSVTELLKGYFEEFEPFIMAERMMKSKNWPRDGYIHTNGIPYTMNEIIEKWEHTSLYARNRGTWMHYLFECIINHVNLPIGWEESSDVILFKKFQKEFLKKHHIQPYRTEWRIVAPDLSLGGSIDFLGKKIHPQTGEISYIILDWKRSNFHIRNNADTSLYAGKAYIKSSYGKVGKYPLKHLKDNNTVKYNLQLNIYRYILKHYYHINVEEMGIVAFPPDIGEYHYLPVPNMEKEMKLLFEHFKRKCSTGGDIDMPID